MANLNAAGGEWRCRGYWAQRLGGGRPSGPSGPDSTTLSGWSVRPLKRPVGPSSLKRRRLPHHACASAAAPHRWLQPPSPSGPLGPDDSLMPRRGSVWGLKPPLGPSSLKRRRLGHHACASAAAQHRRWLQPPSPSGPFRARNPTTPSGSDFGGSSPHSTGVAEATATPSSRLCLCGRPTPVASATLAEWALQGPTPHDAEWI